MSTKPFRVMKGDDADFKLLTFPKHASAKLDGIRCYVKDGVGYSTSNKPIRNDLIQDWIAKNAKNLEGLDGELIVGDPTDPEVYNKTNSGVMSKGGNPDFALYVFDRIGNEPYQSRMQSLTHDLANFPKVRLRILSTHYISCVEAMDAFEADALTEGYEGIMLRDPFGRYKQGRSTAKEQLLLKVKRFRDAEARITGFKERMQNNNEATLSETGHTKRSTHKDNKAPTGMMGAFECFGLTSPFELAKFEVSGFTHADALRFWQQRDSLVGKIVKFKYFPVGIKDLPRFPHFLGFRDEDDIS